MAHHHLFKSMKANIPIDLVLIMMIITLVFSVTILIADKLNTDLISGINDQLTTSTVNNSITMNNTSRSLGIFNTGVPFIFFAFAIAMIMTAWYTKSSPVLMIILIMVIAIVAIVSSSVSNTFYTMSRSSTFATTANNYPYMVYLNDNLPLFIIVIGMIVLIMMFAKPKSEFF